MTLFAGPIVLSDPLVTKLLTLIGTGLTEEGDLEDFLDEHGIARAEIRFAGSVASARKSTVETLAKQGKLREFVEAMRVHQNFAAVSGQIKMLIAKADELSGIDTGMTPEEHIRVLMVGPRPFVNRVYLRDNLHAMFLESGSRVMAVDGPRFSGRSYTWVLVQYVAKQIGRQARLIDLTKFVDPQATPADVAKIIATRLGWDLPADDATSQDYTKGRLVLVWFVLQVEKHGPVCLVFDGLDGANLAEATVTFVSDIAAAALNDELGESVIVLLAFGRPLGDAGLDGFVLREPALTTLPATEITSYFKRVASKDAPLTDEQAKQLAEKVFGGPLPESLPVSVLRDRAAELSKAVRGLRNGGGGG